jgi:phosphoglycolate phosphatase-like HAD superfamily hydrolase
MTEEEWSMVKGAGWKMMQELREKTALFKKPVQTKVSIAVYTPETYQRILQEADDARELDQTWEEWKARTDRLKRDMRDLGVHLHEVEVDLSDLNEFCRHYCLRNIAQTRSRYVTEVSTNKERFEWRKT